MESLASLVVSIIFLLVVLEGLQTMITGQPGRLIARVIEAFSQAGTRILVELLRLLERLAIELARAIWRGIRHAFLYCLGRWPTTTVLATAVAGLLAARAIL